MQTKHISTILNTAIAVLLLAQSVSVVAAVSFKDVSENHANFQAIMALQERGIIGGYPDGTFKPNKTVNRVEALKMIMLGSGLTVAEKSGTGGFKDTDKNEWYSKYLLKGLEMNIVKGYADKTFQPTKTVNLVENLKMLLVANNIDVSIVKVDKDPYGDAPKSEWYAQYLQYAKDNNLIDADADGKIYPNRGMTRARLAESMYRLVQLKKNGKTAMSADDKMVSSKQDGQSATVVDPDVLKGIKEPGGPVNPGTGAAAASGGGSAKSEPVFLGIKIEGFAFSIPTMTIAVGTNVKWLNKDSSQHTVTSDSGKFDSDTLNNGQTWEYTFKEPGVYDYHCNFHPNMKATIIVKPANEVPTI